MVLTEQLEAAGVVIRREELLKPSPGPFDIPAPLRRCLQDEGDRFSALIMARLPDEETEAEESAPSALIPQVIATTTLLVTTLATMPDAMAQKAGEATSPKIGPTTGEVVWQLFQVVVSGVMVFFILYIARSILPWNRRNKKNPLGKGFQDNADNN